MCEYCTKNKYILNDRIYKLEISKGPFGYYLHYVINNMEVKNLGFIEFYPMCGRRLI